MDGLKRLRREQLIAGAELVDMVERLTCERIALRPVHRVKDGFLKVNQAQVLHGPPSILRWLLAASRSASAPIDINLVCFFEGRFETSGLDVCRKQKRIEMRSESR